LKKRAQHQQTVPPQQKQSVQYNNKMFKTAKCSREQNVQHSKIVQYNFKFLKIFGRKSPQHQQQTVPPQQKQRVQYNSKM
jgi:hypothetical protein